MIKKDIWDAFDTLSYSTNIGENAGRSDRMFYKHLQEGMENNDLDKIYEFIEACERGIGLKVDEMVRKLFQKAYEEDSNRLCWILAEKNSIIDYWIYLSTYCETKIILSFVKMDVSYPCFYYECARILLRRARTDRQCEEGIIVAVKKIADLDLSLWERWVRKNEGNIYWQKILFPVLEHVSIEALEKFAQVIHLDLRLKNNEYDVLSIGFEALSDASKRIILESISKIIWNRWCLFIEEKKGKYDFLIGMLFSDYINLILNAFRYTLRDKEEWKFYFLKYGKILEKDMYAWYESQSKMSSIFFYDITQIYYILLVGQECQLIEIDKSVTHCAQTIRSFVSQYGYYWKMNDNYQKMDVLNRLDEVLQM